MITKRKHSALGWLILPAIVFPTLTVGYNSESAAPPDGNLFAFIFVGNSAMSGRDPDYDTETHPRTWNYVLHDTENQFSWQQASEPVGADKNNKEGDKKGGPAMPFLKEMVALYPDANNHFGVIQRSGSGWTIRENMLRGTDDYDFLMEHITEIQDDITIVGLVSMFGLVEAEEGGSHVNEYLSNVKKMVAQFREDLGMPDLPYLHSGYPLEAGGIYSPNKNNPLSIIDQQESITEEIDRAFIIPTDELTILDDIYLSHYDRAGCIEWGKRAASIVHSEGGIIPTSLRFSTVKQSPVRPFHAAGIRSHTIAGPTDYPISIRRAWSLNGRLIQSLRTEITRDGEKPSTWQSVIVERH